MTDDCQSFERQPPRGCFWETGITEKPDFYTKNVSLQPPVRQEKPGRQEFLCLSPLVIKIADSEF